MCVCGGGGGGGGWEGGLNLSPRHLKCLRLHVAPQFPFTGGQFNMFPRKSLTLVPVETQQSEGKA